MEIPGYKIIDTLGRGGMATVYLAIQQSFEREVALKVLSPELLRDPAFGERFLREAKIVSRLVHPNIVTVYDVGEHNGTHYLSMEYVPGQDLKHKRTKITRAQGLRVVKDIARALDYAARKGYVHRDVKPENIMLHEEDGRAVLMDFGIARPAGIETGMTQTGTAIGTPHYMSPEQAKGKTVDARSDLYSLGVVLFLLVTGRVPYDADSAVAVGIKHVAEPIPRLQAAFAVFQPIIDKVLAKNPDNRYQTGLEFVEDLEQIDDEQLRRVDELIDLAAKRVEKADQSAPTIISSAMDTQRIQDVEDFDDERDDENLISTQHWPQSGRAIPIQSVGKSRPEVNPFGRSAWLRNVFWLCLLGAVLAFGFRQQLPEPWSNKITQWHHGVLDWSKQRGVSLTDQQWQLLYDLGNSGAHQASPIDAPVSSANSDVKPVEPTASQTRPEVETSVSKGSLLADQVLADTRPVLGDNGVISSGSARDDLTQSAEVSELLVPKGTDTDAFVQAEKLLANLSQDLTSAKLLAEIYREQLKLPEHRARVEQGLERVRVFYSDEMQLALDTKDVARTRALLNSVEESFPELAREARLRKFERRLADVESINDTLAKAKQQLARDALSSPKGDNAIESFQQVLAQDAENLEALAGLEAVADRYSQLAASKLNADDWLSAKGMVSRGLAVSPTHKILLKQQQQVANVETQLKDRQARVDQLLTLAKQASNTGNIYGRDGAVAQYQDVLALDARNTQAQEALKVISQRTVDQVRDLMQQKQFERARQELARALPQLSERTNIAALERDLSAAIEAALPRVDKMRVAADPQITFGNSQGLVEGADRTIYIGLQYRNFEQTAVLQAILFDGSRSIQIAQVPVVVSGKQGEKVFRIDRPVEGFSSGGYNIDLMLDNQLLLSQRFQISAR